MSRAIRAWYGDPSEPTIAEVVLPQPVPVSRERLRCQEALAAVIEALGIVGVPLDARGLPHLTGIELAR